MVMQAGVGAPGSAAPLWTTIATVTSATSGTTTDAAINNVSLQQAIIYRPLVSTNTWYNGAFVMMGSIHYDSSLTTKTSFTFRVHSPNGSFTPVPGQPVLAYQNQGTNLGPYSGATNYAINSQVSYYGQQFISLQNGNYGNTPVSGTSTAYWATLDVFGGMIQQAKPSNVVATTVIETDCECVSWDILLTRAVISLRSQGNPTRVDGFQGDASTKSWDLAYVPITVTNVSEVSESTVTISGSTVTKLSGHDFTDVAVADNVIINSEPFVVNSIIDANHLTLTTTPGMGAGLFTMTGTSCNSGTVNTGSYASLVFTGFVVGASGDNFSSIPAGNSIYVNNATGNSLSTPAVITTVQTSDSFYSTSPLGDRNGVGWRANYLIGGATLPTFAVEGSSSDAQYYWTPNSNKITMNASAAPLDLNRTLQVTYTYIGVSNFYNQPMGAIASTLMTALLADGVYVNTITGPTITNIEFSTSDSFDTALSALCQFVSNGSVNYWYYMDARRGIHIEEQAVTKIAPWNINVSDTSDGNVLLEVSNTQTTEKMANAALVTTSNTLGSNSISENIICGGTTRTFNTTWPIGQLIKLTYTPVWTYNAPPIDLPFALLNSGIIATGVSYGPGLPVLGGFYWTSNQTLLTEDLGGIAIPSGTLTITYLPIISTTQAYYNAPAIYARQAIEGGSGEYDVSQKPQSNAPLLQTLNISQVIAEYFSQLSESVEIQTYRYGLVSGQGITINLPGIAGPGTYVVDNIQMNDQDNVLHWTITAVRGAAIGDWKTAFRVLTGAEAITTIGGGQNTGTPPAWLPNFEIPVSGDVVGIAPGFGIAPTYTVDGGGNPVVGIGVYGNSPDPEYDVVVKVWQELVSGVCNQIGIVASLGNGTGTISFGSVGATAFTGRTITKTANYYGSVAAGLQGIPGELSIVDFTVTADNGAGVFTVTPDPVAVGCVTGDVFTIRTGGTGTATVYTDSLWVNPYNIGGLQVNGNVGNWAFIQSGTGAGQVPQSVTANTATSITVSPGWATAPDATSVIVLFTNSLSPVTLPAAQNGSTSLGTVLTPNYSGFVIRVEAYLENAAGVLGLQQAVVFREIYLWGTQGTQIA